MSASSFMSQFDEIERILNLFSLVANQMCISLTFALPTQNRIY